MNKNVSNVLNGKTVSVPRKRYGVFKTFFAVRYGNFILTATVAVLTFNRGMKSLTSVLGHFGIQLGPLGLSCLDSKDADRIRRAASKASNVAKRLRKSRERHRAEQEERMIAAEGVTYELVIFEICW